MTIENTGQLPTSDVSSEVLSSSLFTSPRPEPAPAAVTGDLSPSTGAITVFACKSRARTTFECRFGFSSEIVWRDPKHRRTVS